MFDKLEGLVDRLDTVLQELNDPDVAGNQNRFRDLMKEQNELTPIVEKYKDGCPGYVRISYCVPTERIEKALPLFKKLIDDYRK